MKRLLLLTLFCITTTITIAQTTWTGLGVNTNWNNTDNWDTNIVPTATDDVILPTGFTVTLNTPGNVKSIDVQGNAVFDMNTNLTFTDLSTFGVNTTINWNGGTINGNTSTLTNNAALNIANSNVTISGSTIFTNNGIINLTGSGEIIIQTNSVLNNSATGIIDFQANNSGISNSGLAPRVLNNAGLIKTSFVTTNPTDQATISVELKNNDGTIQVEVGILNLNNPAIDGMELTDGIYNVFADAALEWDNNITLSGTLTGNLSGNLIWRNVVRVNSPNTATFNFTGNETVTWISGSLVGGGTLINETTIAMQASNVFINEITTLTNNGAINFVGVGDIIIQTNSVLNNSATGIIDFQATNSGIGESGGGINLLNNAGLIKTSFVTANPTDQATISVELKNNDGTIQVEVGILNLSNGGVNGIELTDGTYNVFADAALEWDNNITLSGTLTGNLFGNLIWRNMVRVNSPNTATFNFTGNETVTWNSGSLVGGGTLINETIIAMRASNVFINEITTLTNNGEINLTGSGDIIIQTNSVLNNTTNAVIDFQADNSGISTSGSAPRVLNNAGLIKTSFVTAIPTDQATISVELKNNDGTIQVEVGILNLNNGGVDGIELTDGTYNVFTNAALEWDNDITLSGTLTGNLSGNLIWRNMVRVNSPNTATFNFTGNETVTWNSGSLVGGGTLINETIIAMQASNVFINEITTLTNNGAVNFVGSGDIFIQTDSVLNNSATGIIDFQTNNSGIGVSGGGINLLNNAGLLKNSTTANVSIVAETTNTGTVEAASGTLIFNSIFDNQATGIVKGIATFDMPTIANFTNNGTFAPGASPGTLTVVGNYTSTTNTVLDIELNGLIQDTEYDLLAITGTNVVFEGNVNIIMAFEANINDTFTIATTSGTIATENLITPIIVDYDGKRYTFDVTYPGSNSVLLTISDKLDIEPPTVITQDITVQLDASGNVSITGNQIDNGSIDNCTLQANLMFSLDVTDFTCAELGDNTVTLTVTDEAVNFASDTATVTVEDTINPVAVTQNITVQLDASGNAIIVAADVNNASTDNCGIASMSLDVTDFTCGDLGANTVNLTVTDTSGNTDSASATVTVEDIINPVAITQNITVQLDASGNASIVAADVNNASTDNCGIASMSLDVTDFTCSELGANTVNLTVTDTSGNTDSAAATVTVEDNILPTILCPGNITVESAGDYVLPDYFADGDITVSDNCSFSVVQTPTPGTILPAGDYFIDFLITDEAGNTDTCTFTLKVDDTTLSIGENVLKDTDIILFPNPASNQVTLSNTTNLELLNLTIMDVKRSIIQVIDLRGMGTDKLITIQDLSSGVYFVKINTATNAIVKRLIKQ